MYVNEMLYNFWGPFLVEETDKLSWAEKSKEENQPKVNFDKNKIHFEEWLQEQMLSIYNGAQANARYDSRIQLIQDKLCLLFDDYLHRMSLLTNRDYESFKVSADNWVKSTKWSIETLLTEYESMKDLPISMKTGDAGKKTREVRMAVNREVRSILIRVLSDMQHGSLSSLQYYRKMKPAPFYTKEENEVGMMSDENKNVAFPMSHEKRRQKKDETPPPISAFIIDKTKEKKLLELFDANLPQLSGVKAYAYFKAAMDTKLTNRIPFASAIAAYPNIGCKQHYNDYVKEGDTFRASVIDPIKSLMKTL